MARILIESLGVNSPGGRRHLEGLLPALRERAGVHRIDLLFRRSLAAQLAPLVGGPIEIVPVADAIANPILTRVLFDVVSVPLRARRGGYDLVVTLANFGPIWSPVPYLVVQQNAMPFSGEFLGRLGRRSRIEWRLRGLLCVGAMRAATINVTPSTSLADLIRKAHPSLATKPFRVLPHGTDLSRFSPRDPDPVGRPFAFICPTTLEAYKGMEILLEATRLLAADGHDFEVRVTAPDRGWPASIQQTIEAHRGAPHFERLRYIGVQPADRMPEAYRSADALLYPSLCESFGFPLLESMACGLPIVAGDLDVNRELCADAASYYAAKSPRACAEAMAVVLGDPQQRRTLREAASRRVQGRDWSWTTYARRFVELCEATIEAGSGSNEAENQAD